MSASLAGSARSSGGGRQVASLSSSGGGSSGGSSSSSGGGRGRPRLLAFEELEQGEGEGQAGEEEDVLAGLQVSHGYTRATARLEG